MPQRRPRPAGPFPVERDGKSVRIPVWSTRADACVWALVDVEDYPIAMRHRWYLSSGYPRALLRAENGRWTCVVLHRLIAPAPRGLVTDHRFGNKLDARRASLRLATVAQNAASAVYPRRNTSSRFRGVQRRGNRWVATAGRVRCGVFDDEVSAAAARDRIAQVLWGDFARLNFPTTTKSAA